MHIATGVTEETAVASDRLVSHYLAPARSISNFTLAESDRASRSKVPVATLLYTKSLVFGCDANIESLKEVTWTVIIEDG